MEATQKSLTRLPPHSEDAEKSLLGALLLDGDLVGSIALLARPEDFYSTAHGRIFEAALTLYQRGARVDAVLIKEELRKAGHLEAVGGEKYLAELAAMVPSPAGAEDYARVVSEKSVARNLIHLCTNIQTAAFEGSVTGDELLDTAESQIFSLGRGAADSATVRIADALNETFAEIERLIESGGAITGVSTGFTRLDEMTAGLQPGDLVIIAGRPSMGKTTFSNCIVDHVAVRERKGVVIFSLEVNRRHLVRNMLCARARVELQNVRKGAISTEDAEKLTRAADELYQAPIFIDDSSQVSVMQIRAKCRRVNQKQPLGLIVVDYIQLMETGRAENRQQEIAQISRALKAMARELNVPVIAISQLNRSVDSREDRRPRMSDLRESGALEQDADLILFLYRESQYNPSPDNENVAEVIVAKQRNGPTGPVPLLFFGPILRFENPAYQEEPA